ncbi:hypothetical protein [Rhizobium leguminosarum]|uniref:Uncharacterized protein n=1 Tax=Rhizobium leguminosarum TaxID=384 RepID=A0A7K3VJS8_RHILE|nr:hypothetical protein [Rhizobium leguminosarum]NEK17456.1 hypothetical protein [Rhizobium leguminosarum]
MPWTIARRILEENKVARSQGWERTKQALLEGDGAVPEKTEELLSDLVEHTICGEKLLRFYELTDDQIIAFRETANVLAIPESSAASRYPLSLDETELKSTPIGHTLVARHKFESGLALVFSTVRVVVIREELEASLFPLETADVFSQYDEIVGLKNRRVQNMDVVWIPTTGNLVEVRADYPKNLPFSSIEQGQLSIKFELGKMLGVDYLHSSVNLFPLIGKMYENPDEGLVVEFAFGTTTASTKHEKMRRGSLSLRDESYHKGGIAALEGTPISPFKLSIEWERKLGNDVTSKPELSLHSTAREGSAGVGVLIDAIVRNCIGIDDFQFVEERMQHYLLVTEEEAAA